MRTAIIGCVVFCLALTPAAGAGERSRVITIDAESVGKAIERGAILWDVRSQDEYQRGHLPGAINMDDIQAVLREASNEDYIPIEEIERALGEAGIDPAREIVLYGAKANTAPYFGYITLRRLGAENAFVYHGGIDDWTSAGNPVVTDMARLPPVAFRATPYPGLLVSTREVVAKLNDPGVQFVDARTVREFNGEDIRALRGGHIPGAVNIPYESNWLDPDAARKLARRQVNNKDGMSLKSREVLAQLYAGLDAHKETIVYCHSGVRASQTAVILMDLGFTNVRVYDSSWLAYGNNFNAPVDNATYFNVARVISMINLLQARVDQLESELEELKAAREKKQQTSSAQPQEH